MGFASKKTLATTAMGTDKHVVLEGIGLFLNRVALLLLHLKSFDGFSKKTQDLRRSQNI